MIGFGFWSIIILTSHFTLSCSDRTQKTRSFWTAVAARVKITRSPPNKLANISDKDQLWRISILVRGSGFECCPQSLPGYLCIRLLPAQTSPTSLPPSLVATHISMVVFVKDMKYSQGSHLVARWRALCHYGLSRLPLCWFQSCTWKEKMMSMSIIV